MRPNMILKSNIHRQAELHAVAVVADVHLNTGGKTTVYVVMTIVDNLMLLQYYQQTSKCKNGSAILS